MQRKQAGLEAQLANVADAIAYNNHDVDDGFRAGLLSLAQLREQPLFGTHYDEVHRRYPELEDRRLIYEVIRRMIGAVVSDLIEETRRRLTAAAPKSIDDVRGAGEPLASMSDKVYEQHLSLKRFLHQHLYSHEKKLAMTLEAQAMIRDLFTVYMNDVGQMSPQFAAAASGLEGAKQARVVADYIAGMTDRYAIAAHRKLADC